MPANKKLKRKPLFPSQMKQIKNNLLFIALIVVLIGAIILAALALHAQRQLHQIQGDLQKNYLRMDALLGISGIKALEPVHYHADWKFYIDNKLQDFFQPSFMELNPAVHMHPGKEQDWVIHVEAKGITLRHFLTTLGITAAQDCLIFQGKEFCEEGNKKIRYYLNGKLERKGSDIEIHDGDKLLVTFGNPSESQLQIQLASVTSFACIQSKNCA